MPQVELTLSAAADLDELIRTHSLPHDTHARVAHSLKPLEKFPNIGPELGGRWEPMRFLLGPWRWLILVYIHLEGENRVVVITVHAARSSSAATGQRQYC